MRRGSVHLSKPRKGPEASGELEQEHPLPGPLLHPPPSSSILLQAAPDIYLARAEERRAGDARRRGKGWKERRGEEAEGIGVGGEEEEEEGAEIERERVTFRGIMSL
ncbi:unnamed protein product [Pleuronectes platessa]|uniref:Uncharacterized protein n=1 Tax=Pleuronectes platessa TaxID=8262 RepID=A0A9N7VIZ6_PLEPL|nr:unnamed protein product [Pleuronectes platessa]